MTDLLSLPAFASRTDVHVVVETPRHAQAKFKYEPELGVFMLSRALTLGLSYLYDWGFVPSTTAPDGDPIDALVLHTVTTSPGVVLRCRPIGILDVLQTQDRRSLRNDRLMVVPVKSRHTDARDVRDLPRLAAASGGGVLHGRDGGNRQASQVPGLARPKGGHGCDPAGAARV